MKKRKDETEILFDIYSSDMQEYLQNKYGRSKDLKKYRTKIIKSGDMLEVEIYPIWNTKRNITQSVEKAKANKEHIKNVNHRNRQKNMNRQLNDNFDKNDIWITLGYKTAEGTPIVTKAQAKKDMENYIKRLRRKAKKLSYEPLKYIYVIEVTKKGHAHIHMVTNFKDRDISEQTWHYGDYPHSRRLAPSKDFGLTGLAKYISKNLLNGNSYHPSQNLSKPWKEAKTYDNRVSRTKCQKLITGAIDNKEYFEKEYDGYKFLDMNHKTSSFVDGYYLYTRMSRTEVKKNTKKQE